MPLDVVLSRAGTVAVAVAVAVVKLVTVPSVGLEKSEVSTVFRLCRGNERGGIHKTVDSNTTVDSLAVLKVTGRLGVPEAVSGTIEEAGTTYSVVSMITTVRVVMSFSEAEISWMERGPIVALFPLRELVPVTLGGWTPRKM
jgi:hypothetical protein